MPELALQVLPRYPNPPCLINDFFLTLKPAQSSICGPRPIMPDPKLQTQTQTQKSKAQKF